MSDISDSIKYLYEKFILRDILSYVTPGAIVVFSVIWLRWNLQEINLYLNDLSIPFLLYIPIYGVFFVVGFAIQCLTYDTIKVFKFHKLNSDADHFKRLVPILRLVEDKDKDTRLYLERYIILKQMAGNNATALSISVILILIRTWVPCWSTAIIILLLLLIIISLIMGQRKHVGRMEGWLNAMVGK